MRSYNRSADYDWEFRIDLICPVCHHILKNFRAGLSEWPSCWRGSKMELMSKYKHEERIKGGRRG